MNFGVTDDFKIVFKVFAIMLVGIFIKDLTIRILPNFTRDKETIIEGEFTITFTLESNTNERKRYVVDVSDTVYCSYLINDKIKSTFDIYSKSDTCENFKVEGIVANE